jgi:hypothetical protein
MIFNISKKLATVIRRAKLTFNKIIAFIAFIAFNKNYGARHIRHATCDAKIIHVVHAIT